MPEHAIWALVSDGTRARVLRGVGGAPPRAPELVQRFRAPFLRAALARRPVPDVPPPASPLDADMRFFAICLCDDLEAHRAAGDFDHLALFATRRMLALLDQEMPRQLGAVVMHRSARNLIRVPNAPLAAQIAQSLRGKARAGQ
ncbi:MAG: host attachment protein [Paracoccaceae bacterium]